MNFIGTWILTHIVALAVHRSRTLWDDFLMRRHFFNRIIKCLTGALLLFSARIIFAGYNPAVITGIEVTARVFITVMGALACGSFLDALNDVYNSKPIAKQKSIKGIVQTAKLVIYIIAGIIGIAILLHKDPTQLLVGLGASAAIMSLVFKDTILGFVASIQISAQDMIHPGDWIEMPSKGADGVVTDINVSNVKVRNWNNTITMIPIYSLVSEAFTNWRSMEESAGRQFRRPLYFDVTSLGELTPQQVEAIEKHPAVTAAAIKMQQIFRETNTGHAVLNLALFRCYAQAYLSQHPQIAADQTLIVRYLPFDENGIKLELYGYSAEKRFAFYEAIVADIINHLFIAAPVFGLKFYQRPSASQSAVLLAGTMTRTGTIAMTRSCPAVRTKNRQSVYIKTFKGAQPHPSLIYDPTNGIRTDKPVYTALASFSAMIRSAHSRMQESSSVTTPPSGPFSIWIPTGAPAPSKCLPPK